MRGYLGMQFGQPELDELLTEFKISAIPKIKRDDTSAHILNAEIGVELTFRDAAAVANSAEDLPEGVLILSNIRYYGVATDIFKPYLGELPEGFFFGESREGLLKRMGDPNRKNSSNTKFSWDNERSSILATLDRSDKVDIVALQLKVA